MLWWTPTRKFFWEYFFSSIFEKFFENFFFENIFCNFFFLKNKKNKLKKNLLKSFWVKGKEIRFPEYWYNLGSSEPLIKNKPKSMLLSLSEMNQLSLYLNLNGIFIQEFWPSVYVNKKWSWNMKRSKKLIYKSLLSRNENFN